MNRDERLDFLVKNSTRVRQISRSVRSIRSRGNSSEITGGNPADNSQGKSMDWYNYPLTGKYPV